MNNQNLNPTSIPIPPQVPVTPPVQTPINQATTSEQAPKKNNFKKIMFIAVAVLGLVILLGLVSLMFQNKKPLVDLPDATAMPATPLILTEESKINDSKIKVEKEEIMQIDIYQKYLTPPQLKFDISF